MTHDEIRAKVPAEVLAAAERYEARDDNWPEAVNALCENVAEGTWDKAGLREMYRTGVRQYNEAVAKGDTKRAEHCAAYAVAVAGASLYAKA